MFEVNLGTYPPKMGEVAIRILQHLASDIILTVEPGRVAHACSPTTWGLRQQDCVI